MKIENIHYEETGFDIAQWKATVRWEDREHAEQNVYVALPGKLCNSHSETGNGFLLMCIVFAWQHHEKRVHIDAAVDPWLATGIEKVIDYLNFWYGREHKISIEPTRAYQAPVQPTGHGAGLFLSGGVDSMSSLMRNCANLPNNHPMRFKYGLVVDGLDMAYLEGKKTQDQEVLTRENYLGIKKICDDLNITPVRITTNIRGLDENSLLYAQKAHGAILAGLAHFLPAYLSDVTIASTNDLRHAAPWGSSPLLDINYSSTLLRVHHDSEDLSRLAKLKIISKNPLALQSLRVCPKVYDIPKGYLNCGQCGKCLRTMMEFAALGIDYSKYGFPSETPIEKLVKGQIIIQSEYHASQYREILRLLTDHGYIALANECKQALGKWKKYSDWKQGESLGGLIKKLTQRMKKGLSI